MCTPATENPSGTGRRASKIFIGSGQQMCLSLQLLQIKQEKDPFEDFLLSFVKRITAKTSTKTEFLHIRTGAAESNKMQVMSVCCISTKMLTELHAIPARNGFLTYAICLRIFLASKTKGMTNVRFLQQMDR